MLIRLSDNKFPYTLYDLQQDYPGVSFPQGLTGFDLADYGAAEVIINDLPSYDSLTHEIKLGEPQLTEGGWVRNWELSELQAPPNYQAFNLFMLTNEANSSYKLAVNLVNPDLTYAVALAYNNIADRGSGDFLQVFPMFCQVAEVTQEHRDEWADAAESFNLPYDFISVLRG